MKEYEFLCGGDYGAWETTVTVELSEEDANRLREYGKTDEFLILCAGVDDIYRKVYKALKQQCDDTFDPDTVMIWVPFSLMPD
jgi:hypothetical protein